MQFKRPIHRVITDAWPGLLSTPDCVCAAWRGAGRISILLRTVSCLGVALVAYTALATDTAERLAFFEKNIRPVLVQHCYKCHSSQAEEPESGLRVDSREALREGGDSGPAVVPHQPEESLLMAALAHDDSFVNMPPSGKLPEAILADFRRWIEMGADDPRDQPDGTLLDWDHVLAGRKDWWSLQPVQKPPVPDAADSRWSTHPVDRFLEAGWAAAGLKPAPPADRRVLIRRVSFLLTGLPPTPEEIDIYEADNSPNSYARMVDRYLASPRFGEHWARHWMDLVKYGETYGSEHDAVHPHAWRYRDYLIRAFNSDLPYDRFVQEQIAGDLLPPRWNDEIGVNESLLGTMLLRMVEFYPTPVDVKHEEGNVIESQIDTLGKTFQGLTLACARCHDHKFDAVSARDFYALYGILASTRTTMHRLDRPEVLHAQDERLEQLIPSLRQGIAELWQPDLERWKGRVAAALARFSASPPVASLTETSNEVDRDAVELHRAAGARSSPLYALAQLATSQVKGGDVAAWQAAATTWREQHRQQTYRNAELFTIFADFSGGDLGTWMAGGRAFRPAASGAFAVQAGGDQLLSGVYPSGVYSHLLSDKHGGTFRSKNFQLDMNAISALVCGTNNARLRLIVENFQSDDLLFAPAMPRLNDGMLRWVTIPVRPQWMGRRAYLEIIPRDDMTYAGRIADMSQLRTDGRSGGGIRCVVFHSEAQPPEEEPALADGVWDQPPDIEVVVAYLLSDAEEAISAWSNGQADDRQAYLLDRLLRSGFLSNTPNSESAVSDQLAEWREMEAQVPVPQRATGVVDEDASDERLFLRGDHRQAEDYVPRRFLEVLHSMPYANVVRESSTRNCSGRLQLAQELTSSTNPLTSRVMANRIWQHLFGEGLVRSVDNFGQLGERPSRPELLDWLAATFVENKWSIKQLIRELMLSQAFQLSAEASAEARQLDPENRLWSHASVRRIDAESIRDALLLVSGRMDAAMYGPSIPLPVNKGYKDFLIPVSGPLDGNGRRSVYLEARRNYPLGLLMAFDQPRPTLTVGRRDTTTVPAQSLVLMNDPFVREQAELLAARVLAEKHGTVEGAIASMYRRTLGRPPTALEVDRARDFLQAGGGGVGGADGDTDESSASGSGGDLEAWKDLAHAIANLKEFIYIH